MHGVGQNGRTRPAEDANMPATQSLQSSPARKSPTAPARPVQKLLLELAHRLHATKAVGQGPAGGSR